MNTIYRSIIVSLLFLSTSVCVAQDKVAPANFDESKVPQYTLPDPLKFEDGKPVDSVKLWNNVRRPELTNFFVREMFGGLQLKPYSIDFEPLENDDKTALNGKATRRQIRIFFRGEKPDENDPKIDILIYTPNNAKEKTPAFIGLNFKGNHAVTSDPGVVLGTVWKKPEGSKGKELVPMQAEEKDRGEASRRWPIEKIIDAGFALVTAYYGDIEPDFDGGIKHGVRRLVFAEGDSPGPNEAGAIATWAWGLRTILSFISSSDKESWNIDPKKIAVLGHSRLGKTALWAGATDERFALVISNNSGCGGAALSRREFGETVHRINTTFPHWFCGNFKKYNLDVNSLPIDQHELIALIAPRPVYIASATEDRWADPKGEFLSGIHADPVYRLLGTDGFGDVSEMPEPGQSVGGRIGYHLRTGKHDILEFDWIRFMNFADKHFSAK